MLTTRPGRPAPSPLRLAVLGWTALALACADAEPRARATDDGGAPGPPPALPAGAPAWWPAPGVLAVDDAVWTGERWVLLDGMEARIHLVDAPGRVRSVGSRGDGPGELRAPRHLTTGPEGGFQVLSAGGIVDRFDRTGAFLDRRGVRDPGCGLPDIREAASLGGRLYLAAVCFAGGTRRFVLLEVGPGEAVRHLVDRPAPGDGAWTLDAPSLAVVDGLLAWGDGSTPCAELLGPDDGEPRGRRCLVGLPVPLPDRIRADLEGPLRRRARAAGVRVAVPDALPWYDALLPGGDGALLARRPVGVQGWRLVRMGAGSDGWTLPPFVTAHASGGRVLLVHTGVQGVSLADLAAAELPLPRGGDPDGVPTATAGPGWPR